MLYQGAPWGALYERITGKQLAPGLYFNLTDDVRGVRPWLELFETGGFSEESLDSVPTNFEVGLYPQPPSWGLSHAHRPRMHERLITAAGAGPITHH